MRPSALFPFLCALVALILSLLCLFAGSTRSFLQNAEMLTLNTSRIGHVPGFRFNATDGHSGGFFSNLLNDLENDIDGLLNDVTSDIARAFHIHDFYSVHLMTYCEGYYEPNSTVSNPSENVTQCSNRTAGFFFDPGSIIQKELADNITLADINWPPEIDKAAKDVKVASKATFVFYCIGIGFTGLAFLASAVGVITNGRFSVVANWTLAILAFLTLGIASGIATAVIVKSVHEINKFGDDIGIVAYKGNTFLGMTWAATSLMLLASLWWIIEFGRSRRSRRPLWEKGTQW